MVTVDERELVCRRREGCSDVEKSKACHLATLLSRRAAKTAQMGDHLRLEYMQMSEDCC